MCSGIDLWLSSMASSISTSPCKCPKHRDLFNSSEKGDVTKNRDVIFYQIDKEGRCRTGKIMKYNRETGRRVKDENVGGKITWVHSILKDLTILNCVYQTNGS